MSKVIGSVTVLLSSSALWEPLMASRGPSDKNLKSSLGADQNITSPVLLTPSAFSVAASGQVQNSAF